VEAPDEKTAIKEFNITDPEKQKRLVAQRQRVEAEGATYNGWGSVFGSEKSCPFSATLFRSRFTEPYPWPIDFLPAQDAVPTGRPSTRERWGSVTFSCNKFNGMG
jgi:hypothetical protein